MSDLYQPHELTINEARTRHWNGFIIDEVVSYAIMKEIALGRLTPSTGLNDAAWEAFKQGVWTELAKADYEKQFTKAVQTGAVFGVTVIDEPPAEPVAPPAPPSNVPITTKTELPAPKPSKGYTAPKQFPKNDTSK